MASRYVASCDQCDTTAFLRPVPIFPGFAGPDCAMVLDMCLSCRVGWRDDGWCSLVASFLHHVRRETRECGQWALEWLTRQPAESHGAAPKDGP